LVWKIEFDIGVEKDLKKLGHNAQRKILEYIKNKIAPAGNPRLFGKPLSGDRNGIWRYRVEDYRLLAKIEDEQFIILTIHVGHRKNVYD
jgi:mRNA interferase RelE/StbE